MRKKSIKKIPLKPSFLRFWRKNSIGFVQGFENCAFWSRNHLKMLDGWPFREDFGVFHHLEHQWLPSWGAPMVPLGEPMVPLLRWTNGSFVWVNQWLLCWGEPMAPFLGCTNGSLLGVHQWLLCWGEPVAPLLGRTKTIFLRLEACRRRLFFWPKIAFLGEKHHFPRLAACRRRFFFCPK